MTVVALGTALRRGELLALRWSDLQLLEALLTVRQALVRGRFERPKSQASRRTLPLGPWTVEMFQRAVARDGVPRGLRPHFQPPPTRYTSRSQQALARIYGT